jgi:RimJ/RimL family protein N-acetyltransferase
VDEELPVGEPVGGGPARPPERRPLEGRFVSLRPLVPAMDGGPLWSASHDGSDEASRLWTYMYEPFADATEMLAWLEECARSDDPLFLAVHEHRAGPVGMAAFMNIETDHRRLEIGHIWYAPSAQRTEANTDAAYLMMREAFDELGYRRVEWKCDALNERSRAAALRLGFTFEGVFRKHMIVRGRSRDSAYFSLVDDDWPAAKGALERWLAADPEGRPSLAALRRSATSGDPDSLLLDMPSNRR